MPALTRHLCRRPFLRCSRASVLARAASWLSWLAMCAKCGAVPPNPSLNPDASPAALRAVRSAPVSLVR